MVISALLNTVTNRSVYCGFVLTWFTYTTVTTVLQLFTISEYRFTVHCQCILSLLLKRSVIA